MERILTAEAMRRADDFTVNNLGIPEEVLVERAGEALAEEIMRRKMGGRILIAVGKGNNGKDGKIVAGILAKKHSFSVTLYDVFNDDISVLDREYDIIVDCIFGTGLNKNITGKVAEIIEKINEKNCFVFACDIPSGLDADTGLPMNVCVKADHTIGVQEFKTGHFLNDGKHYCGKVVALDIGISVWDEEFAFRLRSKDVAKYFPIRNTCSNKGDYKKVAVVGGSKEFFGAPLLSASALAGLNVGAGYGYLFVPESLYSTYAGLNPECIIKTVKDDGKNFVYDETFVDSLKGIDAVAFGMGVGKSQGAYELLKSIINNYDGKLVVDADGLNLLATNGLDVLKDRKCEIVLTPHLKEFSRLTGLTVDEIKKDIINVSKDFAKKHGVTLVLKDATSIITDGEKVCLNITGTPAMAKAGSGDVLSGVLTTLIAEHGVFEGSCVGAYIFGMAGEHAEKDHGEYSVTASLLANYLGKAIVNL